MLSESSARRSPGLAALTCRGFSCRRGKRETPSEAASWDRPARNDSKTTNCLSGGKTTGKVGFEGCRFFPKRAQTGMCEPGARGDRSRAHPSLTALCLLSGRAVPGQPGSPLRVPPETLGVGGAGSQDFPLIPAGREGCFSFL